MRVRAVCFDNNAAPADKPAISHQISFLEFKAKVIAVIDRRLNRTCQCSSIVNLDQNMAKGVKARKRTANKLPSHLALRLFGKISTLSLLALFTAAIISAADRMPVNCARTLPTNTFGVATLKNKANPHSTSGVRFSNRSRYRTSPDATLAAAVIWSPSSLCVPNDEER